MSKQTFNDELLYIHVKNAEDIILKSLPKESELSHRFSKRFQRKMNRLIRKENQSPAMKSFINQGKKAAVIFLIFTIIAFTTAMSVEAYRAKLFETITRAWEEFTSITFKNVEKFDKERLVPVVPDHTPEGFVILEENITEDIYTVIYVDQNNKEIFYEQGTLSFGEIILDTENAQAEIYKIGEHTGTLLVNKGVNQVYWHDDFYYYTLISSIDKDEIIEMVKSILEK